jgi:hypothetical protein
MMKAVWSGVAAAAVVVCFSTPVFAQNTHSINVTANVAAKAKLTILVGAITFPDSDPDSVTSIVAAPLTIDVKARTSASGNVTLTVLANGDLKSGVTDTITIDKLTWSGAGDAGYSALGTSNKTTAQTVGSWTGSGSPSGTQTYALANSWAYATGTYTVTLNYTLTAP